MSFSKRIYSPSPIFILDLLKIPFCSSALLSISDVYSGHVPRFYILTGKHGVRWFGDLRAFWPCMRSNGFQRVRLTQKKKDGRRPSAASPQPPPTISIFGCTICLSLELYEKSARRFRSDFSWGNHQKNPHCLQHPVREQYQPVESN